ncbi:MAG: lipid kinase, partial [Clostridiales bacterium]|nr:lipid kinase [Clostridiales bacterium]
YYLKGASEVTELKPIDVKLITPENIYEEEMFFMIVMNGTSAGGFKNVSPDSEINDGLLNVILFRKMPILEMVPLGIKVLQGVHLDDHRVLTFKTDRLLIESDVDIPTDVDGEHGEKLPLDFSVLHDKIRVFVTKAERDYYERFKNSGN